MFGERRTHQRISINRVARIQLEAGAAALRDCTIIDISGSGARLFVGDGKMPDRFVLHILGDANEQHECRVVWRLGGEMGVEFVATGADQARLSLIERIREEARQTFQSGGR